MASNHSLSIDSYVLGSPPISVSVQATPTSYVVVAHDRLEGTSLVGYFSDPRSSAQFDAMKKLLPEHDLGGLEVKLLCITPSGKANKSMKEEMRNDRLYLRLVFERVGVPTRLTKVRYSKGNSLVTINMSSGKLSVSKLPANADSPESPENESHDPKEPAESEAYDSPEPNEERFWRLRRR